MSTTYVPDLPIKQIHAHPKNPRHDAKADAELVESIKSQGLLQPVAVVKTDKGYTLIAGHRRTDGAKRAGLKTIPATVRDDLVDEAQQIEAMLVENGRRADLSPIEEAEGYQQLELLGYKAPAIAAAVGRDVKTVRARLKLLTLSTGTRKKVHAGQVTIEDAAGFAEFADDTEATQRLEKAATDGQLRYAIARERDARKRAQECAAEVAELAAAGAKPFEIPDGKHIWDLQSLGVRHIHTSMTIAELGKVHDGCLAYAETGGSYPQVHALCTDPDRHADDEQRKLSAEESQRRAEQEQRQQEWRERRDAAAAASSIRVDTILGLFGTNTVMPPALRDVLRALLPAVLEEAESIGVSIAQYVEHIGIREEDRWGNLYTDAGVTLFRQHVADIDRWSDGILTRALVLLLVGHAESVLQLIDDQETHATTALAAGRYLDLLEKTGHEFCDVDTALRDRLDGTTEEPDETEEA